MIKTLPNNSKVAIGAALLAVLFASGCERRTEAPADTTGSSPAAPTATPETAPAAPAPVTPPTDTTPAGEEGQSAGAVIDDTAITAKVKTALLADSDIKGLDVNVDTSQGVVTLKGEVSNQTQIDRAGKIAGEVEGVKSVVNNLSIKK